MNNITALYFESYQLKLNEIDKATLNKIRSPFYTYRRYGKDVCLEYFVIKLLAFA